MRAPLLTTYRHDRGVPDLIDQARDLRSSSTDAELALWRRLRGRSLERAKFRRQHQIGMFIVDFFCASAQLAVEVDGGHHYDAGQADYDAERTRVLESLGIRVLRFSNREVLAEMESVLETIRLALEEPSPLPSPRGRGR